MKIIIFGANEIGSMIASQFYTANDITVIDEEKNKLDAFNKLDISFVDGNASNIEILKQANIKNLENKRVALISGTTVGGMDLTENYFEQMKIDDTLLYLPQSNECGQSTNEMAEILGLKKRIIHTSYHTST